MVSKEKEQDYNDALDLFGNDEKEIKDKQDLSFNESKDNKLLEVKSIATEYKATLEQKIKTLESSDSLQFDYCVNITNDVHHQQGDIDVVELQGDLIANI
jgi:hypothetical protein